MPSRLIQVWKLLADAVRECRENKVLRLAAALAYYAAFSLAPLLVLAVAAFGLAVGDDAAEQTVVAQLRTAAGDATAQAAHELLGTRASPRADIGTTLIGVVGLLAGASALFSHLRDSLNTIWEVAPHPRRGVWAFVVERLLSLALVICVAGIGLIGFGLSVELSGAAEALARRAPLVPPWLAIRGVQLLLSVVTATLLVAVTYRVLPDTRIAWRDIWVGALATGLLIVLSQALIGLYLRSSYLNSAYSAVGAVVVLLIWVYYSAIVFFFGAELTWVFANRFGSRIVPAEGAVALTAGDRALQGMARPVELEAAARAPAAPPEEGERRALGE